MATETSVFELRHQVIFLVMTSKLSRSDLLHSSTANSRDNEVLRLYDSTMLGLPRVRKENKGKNLTYSNLRPPSHLYTAKAPVPNYY